MRMAQAQAHAASKTDYLLHMFGAAVHEPNRRHCQQLPITNLARFHIRMQALLICHHANWIIDFACSMRLRMLQAALTFDSCLKKRMSQGLCTLHNV